MGLSCSCDDFDKGDFDHWWEPGGQGTPPPGTICCECGAPVPVEPRPCVDHMEVWEPANVPPAPWEIDDSKMTYEEFLDAEDRWHAFCDEHGWDSDCERFERCASSDYRCDRCDGLVESIESLGYCAIAPGDLIDNHVEYVAEHGSHEVIWKRGRDGILNPRRMTRLDFAKREAWRRWRRIRYFVRYGWKTWLRWTVWGGIQRRTWHPVLRRLGYEFRYDWEAKEHRWMKPEARA